MGKVFNGLQSNKNISSLFIIVLFTFFSSTTVFGQNESLEVSNEKVLNIQNDIVIESPAKVSNSAVNSNVNFILWFMGTKEDMGKIFSDDGMYTKKSFMTSGREPNRLMVKTLLKKALNIKSC
nr:hypothetical protein [uncultured Flavobacterium sp.]